MKQKTNLSYFEITKNVEFSMLTYSQLALAATTPISELCELYFEQIENKVIRRNIQTLIRKKVEHRRDKVPRSYLTKLLIQFRASSGAIKKSISESIINVQEFFFKEELIEFFEENIRSDIGINRRTAISISPSIYSGNIDYLLWQCWHKYDDRECISILIDKTEEENLANNLKSVLDTELLNIKEKRGCVVRSARCDFSKVLFLKSVNPPFYLTACIAGRKDVTDDYCLHAIESSENMRTLDYVIWCIGMLEKGHLLLSNRIDVKRTLTRLSA